MMFRLLNGYCKVVSSYRTHPALQMSDFAFYDNPLHISGHLNSGILALVFLLSKICCSIRAIPKSPTCTRYLFSVVLQFSCFINIFATFKSLCRICSECTYRRANKIYVKIYRIVDSEKSLSFRYYLSICY